MDRARIWPDFREAWILFHDADVIAIDKPVGVSSQAADPGQPDDVVTRLKRHLGERGADPYLGVHQRLDRETSGVLVFARRREANAGLAAQFEGRKVRKTYVACVAGWPARRGDSEPVTLRDTLAADRDGRMRVVAGAGFGARPKADARGKARAPSRGAPQARRSRPAPGRDRDRVEAVTRVRVLARRGDRAMLELELETGRTHQARVQLAHAGAPIAGDTLYGGAPAERLMLHASALGLKHPSTARPLRVEAPLPPDFDAWLARGALGDAVYADAGALDRALGRALERRWALGRSDARPAATTAFRLVNEEGDGLPRLAVDVYGDWLVAQIHQDRAGDGGASPPDSPWASLAARDALLDRLDALGFSGVYLKLRPRQANVVVDTRRDELAPKLPVRGTAAPGELAVAEEGMPLLVRLGDGLSTGVFLDQRANRRRVREMAAGARVANLFAYTCAFTVAAALGGASRTVSVDASVVALERGRANLERAGVALDAHAFVADDAFAWLARAARAAELFDLIVLDPPSYSTTKRGRFVADSDYGELAAAALALLAPGGKLLACTNHRGISPARFRRILFDACRAAGREAAQIKDLGEPPDFPPAPGAGPHMKSALVSLAR
ncbi:MAG TPA: class I SAM-dependent methyltransferase [Polyangiaceae bacterium]|jgi:23S rRNA (cytosine1962-C5)-methyltransferase|nr:class I SAM-dependent methyltransferase [Polyangiaceae bacterium]